MSPQSNLQDSATSKVQSTRYSAPIIRPYAQQGFDGKRTSSAEEVDSDFKTGGKRGTSLKHLHLPHYRNFCDTSVSRFRGSHISRHLRRLDTVILYLG